MKQVPQVSKSVSKQSVKPKTKLVKITLSNRAGESITRSVKTSGSAAKAARAVAYEIQGFEIVDYVVIS